MLGLYFGNARIVERYMGTSIINEIQRISYQEFGLDQFKNFWLFGYGNGAFEQIYKIFFENHDALVQHVHNDGIELLGEVGIIGITILIVLSIFYFKKLIKGIHNKKELARFILISLLLLILFIQSLVDYSMHAPGILILLITILSIGLINFTNNNRY